MQIENMKMSKNFIEVEINNKMYCLMKENLRKALFEVKRWQYSGGTNFTQKLIQLIAKADDNNKEKLLKGFPEEVCAYFMWFYKVFDGTHYTDDNEFFEEVDQKLEVKE